MAILSLLTSLRLWNGNPSCNSTPDPNPYPNQNPNSSLTLPFANRTLLRFLKSAEKGDAKAMANIGTAYHKGWGVDQSTAEAIKWYRRAAELGDKNGLDYVGILFSLIVSELVVMSCGQGDFMRRESKWHKTLVRP